MSKAKKVAKKKSDEKTPWTWGLFCRILRSAITGSSDELRFTQTGGVELVAEEFLKRESVQKRIKQIAELKIPPGGVRYPG